jgi:hypothetical protein
MPAPALEPADDRVGAPRPIAGGHLGAMLDRVHEVVELADVEAAVARGDEDQVIAWVGVAADAADGQAGGASAELAQRARVADDDDLEALGRQAVQDRRQVENGAVEVVVGRDEGRDPRLLLGLHSPKYPQRVLRRC